jgi:hypothetical protein
MSARPPCNGLAGPARQDPDVVRAVLDAIARRLGYRNQRASSDPRAPSVKITVSEFEMT